MTRIRLRLAALAIATSMLGACAGTPAVAPSVAFATPVLDTGTLGEAPYRVDIPAGWNGELVVLLRGYEPRGVPRAEPWPENEATPVFLERGYAVAQGGYSSQGWAVREAIADTERLRAHVTATHGAPRRTWLVGFSMGGQVALASLERYGEAYDGALSLCGVNVPTPQVFEDALTAVVAFDYDFPDAGLPGIGLSDPSAPQIARIPDDQIALMQGIGAALASDPAAAARLAARVGIEPEGLPGALALRALLLREMIARAGGMPVDNRETVYSGFADAAAFNAGVRRYVGDPAAIAYLADVAPLTGRIGKPLVIADNLDDPTVPARYRGIYPALVERAGGTRHLTVLPPAGEGHCAFSPEQIGAAFEALTTVADAGSGD